MNLRAAAHELKSRPPKINGLIIFAQAVVMLSVSYALVGFFA